MLFFQIQDPEVTSFHPAVGPVSGGSRLTVIGQNLDVGSHVTIVLTNGDNATVHCRLHGKRLHDSVVCKTGTSRKPAVMNFLAVSVDSARVNFHGQFQVVPDPVIESVMPFKTVVRYLIIYCGCTLCASCDNKYNCHFSVITNVRVCLSVCLSAI